MECELIEPRSISRDHGGNLPNTMFLAGTTRESERFADDVSDDLDGIVSY